MFDIYEVNFEVKIRQNVGQICKTIKNNNMSRLVTREPVYSKDVSTRVISIFTILTQKNMPKENVKKNIAEVRCDKKNTKKITYL